MSQFTPVIPDTSGYDAPPVLLPYQQRWVADASPLKVIEKSRRTGITWAEASDNVLPAASSAPAGGMNVYYIAYNQDMTVEYIQACAMWARAFNYAASEIEEGFWEEDDDDKHIKTYTIKFPDSGFRIVALSSRPSNLRGRQGIIVIDEAAFHEQLDELLKAVKHLEQMSEQAGKRNEKHFSLPGIRLPSLRLPHLDGPTWAVLLMGTAVLLLLWWGLDTVWSNLSLMFP